MFDFLSLETVILIALLLINSFTFCLYAYDKAVSETGKARHRISEKSLLIWSFLFGSLGAFCGMFLLRHKTRHKIFLILVPLSLIIQIAVISLLLLKLSLLSL